MASTELAVPSSGTARAAGVGPTSGRPRRSGGATRWWSGLLWVAPALLALAAFVYYPLVLNFRYSVEKTNIFTGRQRFVGLGNYSRLAEDPIFWRALTNNVWYAVLSIVFQVFFALVLAALIEDLRRPRMRAVLRSIYFLPSAISLTVTGLLFTFVYQPSGGLLNGLLGAVGLDAAQQSWLGNPHTAIFGIIMMSQWQGFGYSTLLFAVAIQRIPRDLYESATLDGVGPVRRLFWLTIPLVREMTGVVMVVTISGAFQVFNEVMVMTAGGPNDSSQVLGTWLYEAGFIRNDFGYAAAIATVIFTVTTVLAVLQIVYTSRRRVA